jgi:addiction module RelB/DinJ family antitoxin
MATIQLRTRIDQELKKKGDEVLRELGLDAGAFVSMAIAQLVNRRGLPFAVTVPDDEYFATEYGLSKSDKVRAGLRMQRESARLRRAGQLREIKSLADLVP